MGSPAKVGSRKVLRSVCVSSDCYPLQPPARDRTGLVSGDVNGYMFVHSWCERAKLTPSMKELTVESASARRSGCGVSSAGKEIGLELGSGSGVSICIIPPPLVPVLWGRFVIVWIPVS